MDKQKIKPIKVVEEKPIIQCSFCNNNDSVSNYKGYHCCSDNDCAVKMMKATNGESVKKEIQINSQQSTVNTITPSEKPKRKYKKKKKKKLKSKSKKRVMTEKKDNTETENKSTVEEINKSNWGYLNKRTELENTSTELLLKEVDKRLSQREIKVLWDYDEHYREQILSIYCGDKVLDDNVVEINLVDKTAPHPSRDIIIKQREKKEKLKEFSEDDLEKELERRRQINCLENQNGSEEK